MKRITILFLIFMGINQMFAQDLDIYKNDYPEHIENRKKSGLIKFSKDSVILQDDIVIGKFRRIVGSQKGKETIRYIIFQNNNKPIGDIFIKDITVDKAWLYEDRKGLTIKVEYNPSHNEYERLTFFIKYYIKNGLL